MEENDSCSDSDMGSGSSNSDASSCFSSREASPRGGGAGGGGDRPPPARRVPLLLANLASLPRDGGLNVDTAPSTARKTASLAIPRLSLGGLATAAAAAPTAAAASPPTTARGPPSLPFQAAAPAPQQRAPEPPHQAAAVVPAASQQPVAASQAALLSLDVLSPAFSLQRSQVQAKQLAQHCAGKLGVPAQRLRYFALLEVEGPQDLPPGCSRVAVEVLESSFSLAAMEELLAENRQLKEVAEAAQRKEQQQQRPTLSALQRREPEPADAHRQQLEAQLQQLHAQVLQLQVEKRVIRNKLRHSDSLRSKGKKALQEASREFAALSQDLAQLAHAPGVAGKYPDGQLRWVLPAGTPGTPAAVSDGLQQL